MTDQPPASGQPLPPEPAEPAAASGSADDPRTDSPLSLSRLREAFAEMLSPQPVGKSADVAPPDGSSRDAADEQDPCEISPRSIVEAALFVGHPENRPLSARQIAAMMRGVSPTEIEVAVSQLNDAYAQDGAPYEIVSTPSGFLLTLCDQFGRMRDKLYGRIREAKLSPAAVEVLSVIAYHQPVTADEINRLRGGASGAVLATLVRRKLARLERPSDRRDAACYVTTNRFLRLFSLESLADLPRNEELEVA